VVSDEAHNILVVRKINDVTIVLPFLDLAAHDAANWIAGDPVEGRVFLLASELGNLQANICLRRRMEEVVGETNSRLWMEKVYTRAPMGELETQSRDVSSCSLLSLAICKERQVFQKRMEDIAPKTHSTY
jgi:hypothetical protein